MDRSIASRLMETAEQLFPIHRSLSGPGVRETLELLGQQIPLEIRSIPSGTKVFDWTIPDEWTFQSAWIEDHRGERIVDTRHSNLHIVAYSHPLSEMVSWDELKAHLHTSKEVPTAIPYRTTYFDRSWGFCVTQRQYDRLQVSGGPFRVRIESRLEPGVFNYGECHIPGICDEEVHFSIHCCHPSLANDNCSALSVGLHLAQSLLERGPLRFSYRFLFAPATLGPIAWLHERREQLHRIRFGLVLALLGDGGRLTYKQTLGGQHAIDRIVRRLPDSLRPQIRAFDPFGYDERQYNSVGVRLPIGRLTRSPNGEYPQYHTSADDMSILVPEALQHSFDALVAITDAIEKTKMYRSTVACGEPQLGRRDLYSGYGDALHKSELQRATMWLLSLADGHHDIDAVAEQSGLSRESLQSAAARLLDHGLLGET